MDYTKKFNELLAELDDLITNHNDEIYTNNPYHLIYGKDGKGMNNAGSGSTEDQLAMLMIHIDACRRTCQQVIGKSDADIPAKEWGFIIGAMYASTFEGKENTGDFRSTTIDFKL